MSEGFLSYIATLSPPSRRTAENAVAYWKNWRSERSDGGVFSEQVFERFVNHLLELRAPTTVNSWISYILKYVHYHDGLSVSLKRMPCVNGIFRRANRVHKVKKARTFNLEDLKVFWAMDIEGRLKYLKVVSVLGFFGILRCDDIAKLEWSDVEMREVDGRKVFFVQRRVSKFDNVNDVDKNRFAVMFEGSSKVCPGEVIARYIEAVPLSCRSGRFLKQWKVTPRGDIGYRNQPLGKRTLSQSGVKVAEFLELESPELYTGHCWRRSGASNAAHSGATIEQLRMLGRWRSESVARGYVESSDKSILKNADLMQSGGSSMLNVQRESRASVESSVTYINISGGSFQGCSFVVNNKE